LSYETILVATVVPPMRDPIQLSRVISLSLRRGMG